MKAARAVQRGDEAANDARPTFGERLIWRGVGQREYDVIWANLGASIADIYLLARIQSEQALQQCRESQVPTP